MSVIQPSKKPNEQPLLISPNKVGESSGLCVMVIGLLFLVGTAISILIDYSQETNTRTTNNSTGTTPLWRPHRAVHGMAIAGGVVVLLLTPLVGMLEVLYYKCRYTNSSQDLHFSQGASNAFRSAGNVFVRCLCS